MKFVQERFEKRSMARAFEALMHERARTVLAAPEDIKALSGAGPGALLETGSDSVKADEDLPEEDSERGTVKVLSNVGVLPLETPAYTIVNKFLLPLSVPLLLFAADMRRVLRDTGRLLGAFGIGAVGTTLGTIIALAILPLKSLGDDAWKVAAALMSRHIGGAVNYVAVTEALQVSPSTTAAGLA
eukprot:gene29331-36506_t